MNVLKSPSFTMQGMVSGVDFFDIKQWLHNNTPDKI